MLFRKLGPVFGKFNSKKYIEEAYDVDRALIRQLAILSTMMDANREKFPVSYKMNKEEYDRVRNLLLKLRKIANIRCYAEPLDKEIELEKQYVSSYMAKN